MTLEDIIEQINQADDPAKRKKSLPDDVLIEKYERETDFIFPSDYKMFLKSVSNAFIGFMSPFTLSAAVSGGPGDLIGGIRDARKSGVPGEWLPICEDNGDYYCLTPDGSVHFWDHNGSSNEVWPDLATWAKMVWLEAG